MVFCSGIIYSCPGCPKEVDEQNCDYLQRGKHPRPLAKCGNLVKLHLCLGQEPFTQTYKDLKERAAAYEGKLGHVEERSTSRATLVSSTLALEAGFAVSNQVIDTLWMTI